MVADRRVPRWRRSRGPRLGTRRPRWSGSALPRQRPAPLLLVLRLSSSVLPERTHVPRSAWHRWLPSRHCPRVVRHPTSHEEPRDTRQGTEQHDHHEPDLLLTHASTNGRPHDEQHEHQSVERQLNGEGCVGNEEVVRNDDGHERRLYLRSLPGEVERSRGRAIMRPMPRPARRRPCTRVLTSLRHGRLLAAEGSVVVGGQPSRVVARR